MYNGVHIIRGIIPILTPAVCNHYVQRTSLSFPQKLEQKSAHYTRETRFVVTGRAAQGLN